MNKKIKSSKRGLTFTVPDETIKIGDRYRYIINKSNKSIMIIPDQNGNMTVSRKRSGDSYHPLFDIRSKEVKELVSSADYLEIEIESGQIVVSVYRKAKKAERKIITIDEILGEKTGEIVLKAVSGDDGYQYSILDFLETQNPEECMTDVSKGMDLVYKVASLFSGAGLLDYAFKDPRIEFVYAVDMDADACKTYAMNIDSHIHCMDIRDVSADDIPKPHIVIGGPCCQGFSNANRHNIDSEIGKEKRLLIDEYIRIVKAKNPDVFVIENVPQFYTKDNGMYIGRVFEKLSDYAITCTTIVDSDVGGFTTRKRAVVIGSKVGKIVLPSKTIHTVKTVRDALSKVDVDWFNYNDVTMPGEQTEKAMSYVPQGGNWRDIPEHIHKFGPHTQSNIYRRLKWDGLSPTIVNWRKCNLIHPEKNRILNVSEAAALMGMDKKFHIFGRTLDSKQQQVGNGITQAIGKLIKKCVLEALDLFYKRAQIRYHATV